MLAQQEALQRRWEEQKAAKEATEREALARARAEAEEAARKAEEEARKAEEAAAAKELARQAMLAGAARAEAKIRSLRRKSEVQASAAAVKEAARLEKEASKAEKAAQREAEKLERAAEKEAAKAEKAKAKAKGEKEKVARAVLPLETSVASATSARRLERAAQRMPGEWLEGLNTVDYTSCKQHATRSGSTEDGGLREPTVEPAGSAAADEVLLALVGGAAALAKAAERLHQWRGGGTRSAELAADASFTSDCLAADEPDGGGLFACVGCDGDANTVGLYSARGGKPLRILAGHTDRVHCVAVDRDVIASSGCDRSIRLWARQTGECTGTLQGSAEVIYGLALRDDWLLSGEGTSSEHAGGAGKAVARLWSRSTLSVVATFEEHRGPIWSVALGAGWAVTASNDMSARVWPLGGANTASTTSEAEGHGRSVKSCGLLHHPNEKWPNWVYSVSIEGELVATGGGDGCVRLWAVRTCKCLRVYEHSAYDGGYGLCSAPSEVLAVHLRGGALLSGGRDQKVKLWSLEGVSGDKPVTTPITTLAHGASVHGLSAIDGAIVSVGGRGKRRLIMWRPIHRCYSAEQLSTPRSIGSTKPKG